MKKKIFAFALVAAILLPCIASAASQGYSSYLILPADVQVEGASRKYDYANHKVSITIDKIPSPLLSSRVVIALNKKNFIGSTQQARRTVSYYEGQNLVVVMGNYGSGKKWYGFGSYANSLKDGNEGHGELFAGIESDNVVMTSYN